jgi:hypothetical protein
MRLYVSTGPRRNVVIKLRQQDFQIGLLLRDIHGYTRTSHPQKRLFFKQHERQLIQIKFQTKIQLFQSGFGTKIYEELKYRFSHRRT